MGNGVSKREGRYNPLHQGRTGRSAAGVLPEGVLRKQPRMVDTLSQAEIDALLAALEEGGASTAAKPFGGGTRLLPAQIKAYDFRRPDKFSKDQIRALNMIMEVFTRGWGTFLSAKLRSGVYLEVQTIEQMTYEEFQQSLGSPTVVAVFSMEPLEGSALMEIKLPLAFAFIDRLLGGPGRGGDFRRELTEIEEAIIGGIMGDMWGYLRTAFKDIVPVAPRLESLESNPQFVQIVPPGDIVLYVAIDMKVGEVQDQVVFCFPFILLEPAVSRLSTEQFFAGKREVGTHMTQVAESIAMVPVPVCAQLGEARLSVEEVLSLKEGDVVRLDQRVKLPLAIQIHNRTKYRGRPGQVGDYYAIELTEVVDLTGTGAESATGRRAS